jgi:lambda family phage portal protein
VKALLSNILFKIPAVRKTAEAEWKRIKPGMLRYYAAANNNRFTSDWLVSTSNINDDIKSGLVAVRNRARELWKNNDYVRGLRNRKRTNIIGPEGFKFQSRVKTRQGEVDQEANQIIEQAWEEWQKKENCTMSQKYSFLEVCWLWTDQLVRDGEILARKIKGANNKYGFALELIESDLLDEQYNDELKNGNNVLMGIEYDKWQRPVAYYIGSIRKGIKHTRVPADEIIHHFDPEHAHQVRGISHLAQSMITLHDLQGYDQAAIIAARAGASKMGFIETDPNFALEYKGRC